MEGAGFRAELVFRRPQGFQVLASFSAHIEGAKEDIWIIRQEKEIQIMMMMTMVVVVTLIESPLLNDPVHLNEYKATISMVEK